MPITFKCEKKDPFIIEREGTVFYFDLDEATITQAKITATLTGDRDPGVLMHSLFRRSLYKWDNLKDENGKDIACTMGMRDAVVCKSEIFDETDVLDFMVFFDPFKTGITKSDDTTTTDAAEGVTDAQDGDNKAKPDSTPDREN